jgi:hypothetical protein
VLRGKFQGETIWTSFDSGASTTNIYASFSERFSEYLKEHGTVGNNEIQGIGGAEKCDSIDLADLKLQIDKKQLTLRPAHVMTKRRDHRDWIVANVGKDLYADRRFSFGLRCYALDLEVNLYPRHPAARPDLSSSCAPQVKRTVQRLWSVS